MGSVSLISVINLLVVSLTLFFFFFSSALSQDITNLVYKGCANQTSNDPSFKQTITYVFNILSSQSSKTKFSKTSSGSGSGTASISGLFQCRGDLNGNDCNKCVSKIPDMLNRLCGNTVAGRIQLNGCYGLYEAAGFPQVSGVKLLFKTCGSVQVASSGFDDRRNTAFGQVQNGIVNGNGFYATSFESMYVMGQCEGSLSSGDCVTCIKSAVQNAQIQCGGAISGQIYLHKCYISYSYYPNGVPTKSSHSSGPQNSSNLGKTIAIVVGGTAAGGFLFVFLLFLKSVCKKKKDDY
ncbi:hypothetical protein C5167_032094 [Papaver somniferum]|uniref:Gnk2-homologous domain-containing protein n=1 Tax=Papaver somniferum TaxID=3469 RepID=A0A4Y7KA23_PAPSO|nr:cysteine-rich repeat secretory protein 11-like [Papaver somniferum]RZC68848.1 hypothetical protein C5167_032094 [Papaver somniferum]